VRGTPLSSTGIDQMFCQVTPCRLVHSYWRFSEMCTAANFGVKDYRLILFNESVKYYMKVIKLCCAYSSGKNLERAAACVLYV